MRNTTRTVLACIGILGLAGALGASCSASNQSSSGSDDGGTGNTGSNTNGPGAGGAGGTTFTTGNGGAGTGGFGGACAALSSEAQSEIQPADIIIAVDTSGSMDQEAAQVQQNLNNFASIITAANIDVHVVLIANASVCIPAPLGSGACNGADESLPGYRHVVQGVGSNDSLQKIIETYPQWQPSLRPNASKTIAVVSDDDSDMNAGTFTSQLLALDPTFQGFKFDAIVSSQDPVACEAACLPTFCSNCGVCCPSCNPLAAAEGTVYKQLVQQTGGVFGDLCEQNFGPVFQDMATAVVTNSGISCEYDIPPSPDGNPIVLDKVNVQYTPGGGNPQTVGHVPGGLSDCTQQLGGWYYDPPQNPTKIILCPSTCTGVQGDENGKVEVLFGCDTIPATPE